MEDRDRGISTPHTLWAKTRFLSTPAANLVAEIRFWTLSATDPENESQTASGLILLFAAGGFNSHGNSALH